MTGFFIKKAFFDGWDNLIALVLLNLGFIALLSSAYLVLTAMSVSVVLGLTAAVLWLVLLQVYSGSVSFFTHQFACYQRPSAKELVQYGKEALRYVPLMTGLSLMLLLVLFVVIPFYLATPGLFAAVSVAIVFWAMLFLGLAMLYYYPVAAQMRDRPLKVLKKSMILVLDNLGFSLFLLVHTGITLAISLLTAFMIPGISSILMSHQAAVKLRLYKYDYLEQNPEASKRDIPWEALLMDDRDKIGPRTLRGMIFPWKE